MLPIFKKGSWGRFREGDWVGDAQWKYSFWFTVELLTRLMGQLNGFRVTQRAAGVAFFTAVAFIPFLMILIITAEQLDVLNLASDYLLDAIISNYVPVEKEQIMLRIEKWVTNARQGGAGVLGLILAVLASWSLFTGFYELINDLWHVDRSPAFLRKISRFILLLIVAPPLLALSTSISTFFSIGFVPDLPVFTAVASRIAPLFLTFAAAFLGLKFIPKTHVQTKYAVIAAIVAAVVFEITKYGFGLYVSNVIRGSWMPIYGAIFILPVFLLWNFVVAMVVAATSSIGFLIQHWDENAPPEQRSAADLTLEDDDLSM